MTLNDLEHGIKFANSLKKVRMGTGVVEQILGIPIGGPASSYQLAVCIWWAFQAWYADEEIRSLVGWKKEKMPCTEITDVIYEDDYIGLSYEVCSRCMYIRLLMIFRDSGLRWTLSADPREKIVQWLDMNVVIAWNRLLIIKACEEVEFTLAVREVAKKPREVFVDKEWFCRRLHVHRGVIVGFYIRLQQIYGDFSLCSLHLKRSVEHALRMEVILWRKHGFKKKQLLAVFRSASFPLFSKICCSFASQCLPDGNSQ